MDDDFALGTSVWDTDPVITKSEVDSFDEKASDSQFDDFDDFGTALTEPSELQDDDFGDFGDADEAPADSNWDAPVAGPSSHNWQALRLEPPPSRAELEDDIDEILAPLWINDNIADFTTDDPIRQMEGVNQNLINSESRQLFAMLTQSPPPTKPPNWTRSRIRRQHLISLGIPVNLDEMLPRTNGKPLPPLEIITRPSSAPPVPRPGTQSGHNSRNNSRNSSPRPSPRGHPHSQFGPKPDLDQAKIARLLELDQDTLVLQSLPTLQKHLADLREQTATTSALLTHLLQARDALQQDSDTYNGLIAEMVGEAQKLKTARTPVVRRGSYKSKS